MNQPAELSLQARNERGLLGGLLHFAKQKICGAQAECSGEHGPFLMTYPSRYVRTWANERVHTSKDLLLAGLKNILTAEEG